MKFITVRQCDPLGLCIFFAFAASFAIPTPSYGQDVSSATIPGIVVEGAILKTIDSISLATQVGGLLQEVAVKEGSKVKAGQEIAKIHDASERLELEKAKLAWNVAKKKQSSDIDFKIAEKNMAVAEKEYSRAIEANSNLKNVYTVSEVERLKLVLDRSTLEVERAKFQKEMSDLDVNAAEIAYRQCLEKIKKHKVLAPCDGIVVSQEKRVGEWVEPGSVVLKLVQIDRLRIEGFVNQVDAAPSLVGALADVELDNSGLMIQEVAELVFVSVDANPVNSQVRVFLEIDNKAGKLRPGLRPKAVIRRPE